MRKKRAIETPEERVERVNQNVHERQECRAADEDAMDERVRRNIEQHGP